MRWEGVFLLIGLNTLIFNEHPDIMPPLSLRMDLFTCAVLNHKESQYESL
jgi:hypothetical protein